MLRNSAREHVTCIRRAFLTLVPILALALAGRAQSVPDGAGKAEFQRTCGTCHSLTVVTAKHLSDSGWENVVDNMITRGAQVTPDDEEQIVRYLAANFGIASSRSSTPESAAPQGTRNPASAPVQPIPVLDASQVAQAKALIRKNGCLSCHRINEEGSYSGPYLGDVAANRTAEGIRSALVSPGKELAPQNRSVRLVTQDGKTVIGKLLNQDGFSVQLIDASGHLLTFQRANLQDFDIVTANSMPSYADRMSAQELSLLIRYLEIQTGTGQKQ